MQGGAITLHAPVGQELRARSSNAAELTPRQRDILGRMAAGASNAAIGRELQLSLKTVESHVRSIFIGLGLRPDETIDRRVVAVLVHLRADPLPQHIPGHPASPG